MAITDPPLPDLQKCPDHHTGSYKLILNSFNDTEDKFFVSNLKKDEYYQVYDYFYEILDSLDIGAEKISVNIQNNYIMPFSRFLIVSTAVNWYTIYLSKATGN